MATTLPVITNEYRVLLVDPKSHTLLAQERCGEYCLARVAVPLGTRPARQLQETFRTSWGVTILILDLLAVHDNMSPCAVAELLAGEVPAEFRAVLPEQIRRDELSEEGRSLFQDMLRGTVRSPFTEIGWIDRAIAWLETATGRRLSSKADIEQHNAGGAFTLLRFRTQDGCDYWLKATGAPNLHERNITSLLSRLCAGHVPEVVAEIPEWNAWMMRGQGSVRRALPTEATGIWHVLRGAVKSLAALQMNTVGSEQALFAVGACDHGTHVLRAKAETLFAYIDEAMSLQTSTKVPRLGASRLCELRRIFEDVCGHMEQLGLPPTVLHGDMNLGNILVADGRCVFIDWSEAYVGSPLVTFEHILLLNQVDCPSLKSSRDACLRQVYRGALGKILDVRAVDEGFACAPMIAAASSILGRGDWLRTHLRDDPRRQAYVRAIARHMDRAAREPALLRRLRC
ncbi:phosphotransferase [Terriglobus tenax]|uniref:phosphotransferase n=1 Tax=Terriglobus tenax TaxID=1111115 RepID=UPI0021DFB1B0|nr:phosphotransferase [Terriglobus tenax]